MRLFEVLKIGLPRLESLGLDVLTFHQQKAVHAFHILRQACQCALDHRDDYRQSVEANKKFEMELADVINDLVFADCLARDDENYRATHPTTVLSASTSRISFSRPCEATRM